MSESDIVKEYQLITKDYKRKLLNVCKLVEYSSGMLYDPTVGTFMINI